MTNVYDFLKYHHELYRQFSCKNILISYYDCPQARKTVDVFTHYNMFIFDIRGKKRFHKAGKSWVFEPGNGLLMKKGAFYQEMYFGEGLRSLTFYVSDSQLRQLIREYYTFNQRKLLPNQATEPIIELELNIGEVSFESSIENNAHFSRRFKEKTGISPLQYRREQMASALV